MSSASLDSQGTVDGGSRLIRVREGGVEVAADPPPQCRCGMIIRQRLAVGCGAQELFGVDPGT